MGKIEKEPVSQDLKESNQSLAGSQSNAVGLDVSLPRGVPTFFRYRTPVKQLISSVFNHSSNLGTLLCLFYQKFSGTLTLTLGCIFSLQFSI